MLVMRFLFVGLGYHDALVSKQQDSRPCLSEKPLTKKPHGGICF